MEISYAGDDLLELCTTERLMKKELGVPGTKKLKGRLADLEAASNVRDLVAGRPHPLEGDRVGEFALDLDGGRRLVFAPANEPVPRTEDEAIDWGRVTKVRITFVGDYHD